MMSVIFHNLVSVQVARASIHVCVNLYLPNEQAYKLSKPALPDIRMLMT